MPSKTVMVVQQEFADDGPFDFGDSAVDGSLDRVIASLAKIREKIPEEYRSSARCEINSVSGFEGSHSPDIEVFYRRPETPEEEAEREMKVARYGEDREAYERAQLAALQAKYDQR